MAYGRCGSKTRSSHLCECYVYALLTSDHHDEGWASTFSSESERWLAADGDCIWSSSRSLRDGSWDLADNRPVALSANEAPVRIVVSGGGTGWYVLNGAAGDVDRELAAREWVPSDFR
jgi:hypothetical protein